MLVCVLVYVFFVRMLSLSLCVSVSVYLSICFVFFGLLGFVLFCFCLWFLLACLFSKERERRPELDGWEAGSEGLGDEERERVQNILYEKLFSIKKKRKKKKIFL